MAAAKEPKVPVSTIAFGTDNGTITIPQEPLPIPVPVDKAALKTIAADTGGKFYAAASEGQLKQVYEDIGSSVGYDTEQREISTWFIGAALLLLLVTGGFSLVWFSACPSRGRTSRTWARRPERGAPGSSGVGRRRVRRWRSRPSR